MKNFFRLLILPALFVVVSCDGGGEIPELSMQLKSTKTFAFNWHTVKNVSEYHLLENHDGISGYTRVASFSAGENRYNHSVLLPKRLNASYILQACGGEGCNDSTPVFVSDSMVDAIGYVKASNTEENDKFGYSIALSENGNTLVVGVPYESSNAFGIDGDQSNNDANESGAVYVFTLTGNTWSQQAYIKASNTEEGDWFGKSIAISIDGNTLAVGAPYESSNTTIIDGNETNNDANDSGAAYVFSRLGSQWTQQAYIKASNTEAHDWFGSSLAVADEGNILAVAAKGTDAGGSVYVFKRADSAWSQQAIVEASNAEVGDWFGESVSLSNDGNTMAVGAFLESSNATGINGDENDNSASGSAAVYVFSRNTDSWTQEAYIKASNSKAGIAFGESIALAADGDTLAVGATYENSNATGIGGDQYNQDAEHSGAVYVFTRSTGIWTQQAYMKASNTASNDYFGAAIALSADGNMLAATAYGENMKDTGIGGDQNNFGAVDSGAVYLFTRSADQWTQMAYIKASNTDTGDLFGTSIALSADGKTLAVGATNENSIATGVDGDQSNNNASNSGAVYIY